MDKSQWHVYLNQFSIHEAIKPGHWGPPCWNFADYLCFSYPIAPTAEEQQNIANYFNALKHVLPCVTCKTDFKQMLEEDPIDRHLHSREALVLWILDKHNRVNSKLGKKQLRIDEYVDHFQQRHAFKMAPSARSPTGTSMKAAQSSAAQARALSSEKEEPCCSGTSYKTLLWILLAVGVLFGAAYVFSKRAKTINH